MLNTRDRVNALLSENLEVLKTVAAELLEKETIVLDDLDRIIKEQKERREEAPPEKEPVAAS